VSATRVRAKLDKICTWAKERLIVLEHGDGAVSTVEQANPVPAWGGSGVLVVGADLIDVGTISSGGDIWGRGGDVLHGSLSTHRGSTRRGNGSGAMSPDGGLLCGGSIRCTIGGLLCGVRSTRCGGAGLSNSSSILGDI
jgi:hypothetical protein